MKNCDIFQENKVSLIFSLGFPLQILRIKGQKEEILHPRGAIFQDVICTPYQRH